MSNSTFAVRLFDVSISFTPNPEVSPVKYLCLICAEKVVEQMIAA
ncbi:MAG: hypothetical protein ACREVH_02245 [Gammaproteobacteria bacterium]